MSLLSHNLHLKIVGIDPMVAEDENVKSLQTDEQTDRQIVESYRGNFATYNSDMKFFSESF